MKEISDRVRPGERVLCAVSGGADSMYLLARMLELAGEGGFQVLCAHYNHRLRGAESERDEAFVRAWCGEHAVPVFVGAYGGSRDRKSTRLNSSHPTTSRMPSSA